jgi:hypothetical protein
MDKVRRETFPDQKGYARSGVPIDLYREILIFTAPKTRALDNVADKGGGVVAARSNKVEPAK